MKKYRQESIEKQLKRVLSSLISEEVRNPKVSGMISVTRVSVTKDMKFADVKVSILNSKGSTEKVIEGLNEVKGFLRSRISHEIKLRYIPELRIEADDSIEYGVRISKMLNDLK